MGFKSRPRRGEIWSSEVKSPHLEITALCILQCVDQLTKIQTELQETVKDLAKGKKKYFETEQMAHAVREKADIEAKYVY